MCRVLWRKAYRENYRIINEFTLNLNPNYVLKRIAPMPLRSVLSRRICDCKTLQAVNKVNSEQYEFFTCVKAGGEARMQRVENN